MALSTFFTIIGGWALDKYKPSIVFILMGIFTGLSLLLTSLASELWHVFLSYSLLLAIGTGPVYVLVVSVASRWFIKKRGLAIGIVASGAGIGLMVMTPFAAWLITNYGWNTSYFILALIAFIMVPCALLLKGDPHEKEASLKVNELSNSKYNAHNKQNYSKPGDYSLAQAVKYSNFWLLQIIFFLLAFSIFIIQTHLVPHAIDLGINPVESASVLSIIGGGAVLGRLVIGKASDNMGRKRVAIICALLMAIATLWLIWSSSLWMLHLFAIVFGFAYGGTTTPFTALVSDIFGLGHIGIIMATISIGWGVGAVIGPALAGYLFDINGSYIIAFWSGIAAALITAILTFIIKIPTTRIESL